MSRIPLFLIPCLFVVGCASNTQKTAHSAGSHMMVRTTAYVASEPGGAHAATGELLHFGGQSNTYSAAADWSWMPLGTRFKMAATGRTYVVEDYGSALVGRKTIDLFMPSRSEMGSWGCRNVDIQILEWGSSAMSLKLLEPRQKFAQVRTMVAAIQAHPAKDASASEQLLARR